MPQSVGATQTGYTTVPAGDQNLLQALATVGPIAVAINCGHPDLNLYTGGNLSTS